jgi:tetratricopeptide (TPR) repeat protein
MRVTRTAMHKLHLGVALTFLFAACAATPAPPRRAAARPATRTADLPVGAQARTLAGQALYAPALSSLELAKRSAALDAASRAWDATPGDPDALIWVGRRLGYLGRMREALDTFTIGVAQHPGDARMLRHRGHRYISVREFELALADLERAAKLVRGKPDEVEPDGMPNKSGIPLETLQSNIHYHLGLAHFLLGEWSSAETSFRDAFAAARNADNQCSATHWLYLSLRKQGKHEQAAQALEAVRAIGDVAEYRGYFELCRGYLGEMSLDEVFERARARGGVEFATCGFGAAQWHAFEGQAARSREILDQVLASENPFAFGFLAAEAERAAAAAPSPANSVPSAAR